MSMDRRRVNRSLAFKIKHISTCMHAIDIRYICIIQYTYIMKCLDSRVNTLCLYLLHITNTVYKSKEIVQQPIIIIIVTIPKRITKKRKIMKMIMTLVYAFIIEYVCMLIRVYLMLTRYLADGTLLFNCH